MEVVTVQILDPCEDQVCSLYLDISLTFQMQRVLSAADKCPLDVQTQRGKSLCRACLLLLSRPSSPDIVLGYCIEIKHFLVGLEELELKSRKTHLESQAGKLSWVLDG